MSEPLVIAVPSKGRLKEQVDAWLADCGLHLRAAGGSRGYMASIPGHSDVLVRLLSAGDIAEALDAGEVHMGVTGEDLLRERSEVDNRVTFLRPLGFGRADLVVAAPRSWLDVDTMEDLEAVSHDILARTGRRMRVATKYVTQTRAFFARHGLVDYRITESGGATEGAPAAGTAELIVDITTTGATLAANGLKILNDGLILASQAHLVSSQAAEWSASQLAAAERLLRIIEARSAAHESAMLVWPDTDADAQPVVDALVAGGASRRPYGLLVPAAQLSGAALALTQAGVGPVTVSRPEFVFDLSCGSFEELAASVSRKLT